MCLTLPTLPYAYFPAFVQWKGSVSIEHEHFTNYVRDILMSFIRFGVRKFLIIDGGYPPIRPCACWQGIWTTPTMSRSL